MSKPDQIFCEACHNRPATHCICDGGTGKSSNLCEECFQSSTPSDFSPSAATVRDAHCQYCGGQPCTIRTDIVALMSGVKKMKFVCLPCSREHSQFIKRQLQPILQDASRLSQLEQLTLLQKLDREADEYLKTWVSERNS
jgi:protein-arginine kinase activator protein McsA